MYFSEMKSLAYSKALSVHLLRFICVCERVYILCRVSLCSPIVSQDRTSSTNVVYQLRAVYTSVIIVTIFYLILNFMLFSQIGKLLYFLNKFDNLKKMLWLGVIVIIVVFLLAFFKMITCICNHNVVLRQTCLYSAQIKIKYGLCEATHTAIRISFVSLYDRNIYQLAPRVTLCYCKIADLNMIFLVLQCSLNYI